MMSYDDTMTRLEEMRPRYDAGFSTSDREFLEGLNYLIFKKPITLTGCADCYRDAYLSIRAYLKRSGTMPEQTNYRLLRGIVVSDFGSSDFYVLDIPDDVAERYIIKDRNNIRHFERLPEDWEARITRRIAADEVNALKAGDNTETEEKPVTTKKNKRSRKETTK